MTTVVYCSKLISFLLWAYFKELVSERENQTEQEMFERIIEVTNHIKNNERAIPRCRLCIMTLRTLVITFTINKKSLFYSFCFISDKATNFAREILFSAF